MYTLYYSPGACSMAIHIALHECGQPVTLEKVDLGAPRPPEFLTLNPRGQVPVLVDDGMVLREGAAILLHILDKHQSPLMPRTGKERMAALEWLMFCNATLHPAYSRCFFLMRNGQAGDGLMDASIKGMNALWAEVEQRLEKSAYLAGENLTIADILMTVIANWSARMTRPVLIGPKTKALFQKIISRPSYQKALEVEQVEYKAAV